ncbi:type II toxin-antitoxin system RelE/ParE family toxin [Bosea sp. (in: a-proteobacteria)]|uniref:type II toxin-antitoxin system RelE/ParE family toxin n=1 Tax=Bosea sp. (in: a-proteobacteria) TaxID=1871050 RepID=UPI00403353C1
MKLEWGAFALADREALFDWIARESPRAAAIVDERIETAIETLPALPDRGRPGRIAGTREFLIAGTSCIAAYRVSGDTIRVLRILHMAQMWPEGLP